MPSVTINFSGERGSGKTILSRSIRDHLGNLGFKVHYITPPGVKTESDILKITTTKRLLARAAISLPR